MCTFLYINVYLVVSLGYFCLIKVRFILPTLNQATEIKRINIQRVRLTRAGGVGSLSRAGGMVRGKGEWTKKKERHEGGRAREREREYNGFCGCWRRGHE